MDKTPKLGTRRRSPYGLLVSRPGEWIDFDPMTLGYESPAGAGHVGLCRWRHSTAINSYSHRYDAAAPRFYCSSSGIRALEPLKDAKDVPNRE
jgi:hypothetical protein